MEPKINLLRITYKGNKIEPAETIRISGKEIAIGKPFEETSKAADGKTPRIRIVFLFKHQDAKNPTRIDVWRSEEDPNIGEIGYHQFKENYAHPEIILNAFRIVEEKLAELGFHEVRITKGITRTLAFFLHRGYTHESRQAQDVFERKLRGQWPTGIAGFERSAISKILPTFFPDRPERRLATALARLSVHQRKCPKTTIRKRLKRR